MRTVTRKADVAAGAHHFSSAETSRSTNDNTGEVSTGNARKRRAMHCTRDVLNVAGIDGRRSHLDQHLTVAGHRRRYLLDPQVLRLSKLVDHDGSHRSVPSPFEGQRVDVKAPALGKRTFGTAASISARCCSY